MDETNTRWFRWVADHAQYIFWGVWGAGTGAFGSVFFKAVDIGGDALRVYMAILTVMMGGALGLVASRAMAALADIRNKRRKANIAYLKLRRLRRALVGFSNVTRDPTVLMAVADGDNVAIGKCLGAFALVTAAASTAPEFDELADSQEDTEFLSDAENAFYSVKPASRLLPRSRKTHRSKSSTFSAGSRARHLPRPSPRRSKIFDGQRAI